MYPDLTGLAPGASRFFLEALVSKSFLNYTKFAKKKIGAKLCVTQIIWEH